MAALTIRIRKLPSYLPLLLVATFSACTIQPIPNQGAEDIPAAVLLDHPAFRDDREARSLASMESILAASDAMRAFLDRHVDRAAPAGARLQQLLAGMADDGYLDVQYESTTTRTAEETFTSKTGNCLAFTNLFIALARLARLDVNYQLVDVPPSWSRQGAWVVLDRHINAIVHGVRIHGAYRQDYVIDFNIADYQGNYRREEVEDHKAFALFYGNLGVEDLRSGDYPGAYAHLVRAIELAPRQSAHWANLGVLFGLAGLPREAEAAYLRGLRFERGHPTALANLAKLYHDTGRPQSALAVETRIRRLRDQDPYYHYQRAWHAYRQGQWSNAAEYLNLAISLKRDEHQFFALRALLAVASNDPSGALKDLRLAHRLAELPAVQRRYAKQIERLESAH